MQRLKTRLLAWTAAWLDRGRREQFLASTEEEGGHPYLSVMHVAPKARLRIGGSLPYDVAALLEPLRRSGVVLAADGRTEDDLTVTDVLSLDPPSDKGGARVACVLPGGGSRALYLFGAAAPPGAPTNLADLVAAPKHQVLCRSRVERVALSYACNVAGIDPEAVNVVSRLTGPAGPVSVAAVWATKADARAFASSDSTARMFFGSSAATSVAGLRLISYAPDRDARRRAAVAPLLSVVNVDVDDVLPKRAGARKEVVALLASPLVLAGAPGVERGDAGRAKLLAAVVRVLLEADVEVIALNNFYATRFPSHIAYYGTAAAVLRDANDAALASRSTQDVDYVAVGRPDKSVLEQFGEEEPGTGGVAIEATHDVGGTYLLDQRDLKRREVRLTTVRLEGMPLRPGDRVALRGQRNKGENGDYFVVRVTPGQGAVLASPAAVTFARPRVDRAVNDGRWRFRVPEQAGQQALRPGDRVILEAVDGAHGVVTAVDKGEALVLLDALADAVKLDKFHPLSLCSIDPSIPVREMCINEGGVWDRPCERDEDCPFFQAAPSDMARGGCGAGGYCEMPIGVRNAGYRHYDAGKAARPVCRGGPPPKDGAVKKGAVFSRFRNCDFVF